MTSDATAALRRLTVRGVLGTTLLAVALLCLVLGVVVSGRYAVVTDLTTAEIIEEPPVEEGIAGDPDIVAVGGINDFQRCMSEARAPQTPPETTTDAIDLEAEEARTAALAAATDRCLALMAPEPEPEPEPEPTASAYTVFMEEARAFLAFSWAEIVSASLSQHLVFAILFCVNLFGMMAALSGRSPGVVAACVDAAPIIGVIGTIIGLSAAVYAKSAGGGVDIFQGFATATTTTVYGGVVYICNYFFMAWQARA